MDGATDAVEPSNVHVTGLDDTLLNEVDLRRFAEASGVVVSSKIIRDRLGVAHGTGFVRFAEPAHALRFISAAAKRGFGAALAKVRDAHAVHRLISQVSYKSALGGLQDFSTTNLYLANLPRHWKPDDVIAQLFPPPDVVRSVRILYVGDRPGQYAAESSRGPSRGVGFARLDTRTMAEGAISRLNGLLVEGSPLPLQVRFADSTAQRAYKSVFVNGVTPPAIAPPSTAPWPYQMPPMAPPLVMPRLPLPPPPPPPRPLPLPHVRSMPPPFFQPAINASFWPPQHFSAPASAGPPPTPPLPAMPRSPSPVQLVKAPAHTALGIRTSGISSSVPGQTSPRQLMPQELRRTSSFGSLPSRPISRAPSPPVL